MTSVATDFRKRQRAYRVWMLVAVLAWIVIVPLSALGRIALLLAFANAVACLVAFALASRRYRCPACGAKPVDREGDETWALDAKCRACGVELRA